MQTEKGKHIDKITAASLLIALGIIYGDIGTSPLYVLKAVVLDRNIEEVLVLGGVSCIFWTLVFQTTLKYIVLTLRADNEGEGGIFSLYSLVRRYGKKLVIPTILGATTLLADGIITPPNFSVIGSRRVGNCSGFGTYSHYSYCNRNFIAHLFYAAIWYSKSG
jgi:KUP system potassium uptake protein